MHRHSCASLILAVTCSTAACNTSAPAQPPSPSAAPAASAPAAVALDPATLVGTWSFDRTCASEDGITLNADGVAGTDQGTGLWAVDARREKLVIVFRAQEMGAEENKLAERHVWTFMATRPVGADLIGRMEPRRMGEQPVEVNARRCPAAQ